MLQISNINKSFSGLKVLNNLSFKIKKGSISGLIGPNGAGKTTLFNVINGSIKPDSGSAVSYTHLPSPRDRYISRMPSSA